MATKEPQKEATQKQRAFISTLFEEYANKSPRPKQTAYMKVYGSTNPKVASPEASRLLQKPHVRALYQDALAEAKLIPSRIAKKLNEHLEATNEVWNRTTKEMEKKPNYKAQMDAIKEVNSLLDAYPKDKEQKSEVLALIQNLYS